jgi:pSer/pThr/pTyr-binding forkhead associated (FHA) protein
VPPTPAVAPQVLPSIGGIGRAAAVNAPPLAQPPPDEPHTRTLTRAIAQPATMDRTIRLRISIDSGPNSGARFAFPEGEFVIGRAPDSDLPVTDDTVSHHHAKLVVTSRRATIEDLGSLNGTKFGGTVELRGVAILSPGDHVSFGSTSVTIGPGDQHG